MDRLKKIFTKESDAQGDKFGYVALGIALIILATKVTAIIKLQALTAVYGFRSLERDIFIAANIIPEFIYTIIVIGGINAALIPVLNKTVLSESEERQKNVFSSIVNIYFITMVILAIIVYFSAEFVVSTLLGLKILNTANTLTQEQATLFVETLRILIISPIILSVSSVFSSILQVKRKFWITSLAPFFYNLGLIFAILLLPYFHNDIKVLGYGVIIASILHFIIQLPTAINLKVQYKLFFIDLKDKYIKQAIMQTLPRSIGLATEYFGNIFQTLIALTLTKGSLSAFNTATSIRDVPISVFGLSVAQSVFPQITEYAVKEEKDNLLKLATKAMGAILFWTLPVTAILIVLKTPITQILFGIIAKISFAETNLVALCIAFVSLSIVPMSLLFIVSRIFYSLNDSKTPTIISLITVSIEVLLSFAFVNLFSHFDESLSVDPIYIITNIDNYFQNQNSIAAIAGMGLATFIAMSLNLIFQVLFLKFKGIHLLQNNSYWLKKTFAFIMTTIIGFVSFNYLNNYFNNEKVVSIILFTVNIFLIMTAVYLLTLKILKDPDISVLDNPLRILTKVREKFANIVKKAPIPGVGS